MWIKSVAELRHTEIAGAVEGKVTEQVMQLSARMTELEEEVMNSMETRNRLYSQVEGCRETRREFCA